VIKRVAVLVEGQTEETFVKEILSEHLSRYNIFPYATRVCTKRVGNCRKYRGGVDSYSKIKTDIQLLSRDSNINAITTMFDFYAFPTDAPGYSSLPIGNGYVQVEYLEDQIKLDINDTRFIPYLMLHEFEAFLFCTPEKIAYSFPNSEEKVELIRSIAQSVESPEEINNSPLTAPSKRILNIFPEYEKPLHGCLTVMEIGLDTIRSQCSHFNQWLTKLEHL